MVQTTPKHHRTLHMISILMFISSDNQIFKSFITFYVFSQRYPSWGSKFSKFSLLSIYRFHSLPFQSQIILTSFYPLFFTLKLSNNSQSLSGGVLTPAKTYKAQGTCWTEHIPIHSIPCIDPNSGQRHLLPSPSICAFWIWCNRNSRPVCHWWTIPLILDESYFQHKECTWLLC